MNPDRDEIWRAALKMSNADEAKEKAPQEQRTLESLPLNSSHRNTEKNWLDEAEKVIGERDEAVAKDIKAREERWAKISKRMRYALSDVVAERWRQEEKWGDQTSNSDLMYLTILTEEVGEAAKAILEHDKEFDWSREFRKELVQIAAVAVAWIEAFDTVGYIRK